MTLPFITTAERRRRIGVRHRLRPERRLEDAFAVPDEVVALHATDPATVFLSAAARLGQPTVEQITSALYDEHELVRHHAMRRTVWVMSPEVAREAHASSSRKVAATERRSLIKRFGEHGTISDAGSWLDDAVAEICALVKDEGPLLTKAIGEALPHLRIPVPWPGPRKDVSVDVMAHSKAVQLAGFDGHLVRTQPSSWISQNFRWGVMSDWIEGGIDTLDVDDGAAGLLQRWLERFGPGTMTDLKWWTGWTATQTKGALKAIDATEVALDGGGTGWVASGDVANTATSDGPWLAVLPGLDPTPMGWKDRQWFLADTVAASTFDRFGNAGPSIWRNGQMIGGWVQRADGDLALDLHVSLDPTERKLLDFELERVRDFVGDTRFKVRFPAPNQAGLLA